MVGEGAMEVGEEEAKAIRKHEHHPPSGHLVTGRYLQHPPPLVINLLKKYIPVAGDIAQGQSYGLPTIYRALGSVPSTAYQVC